MIKKPEFVSIQNLAVSNTNTKGFTLHADALFKNPNDLGGTLKPDDLKIYINDQEVAQIKSDEFSVPAATKFNVPLNVTIPIDSIIKLRNLDD
ncbi:hypothetical protein J4050_11335 [Winogradskyella sp. DF17]|uniref:Uncharacterized protein n=1 Tax=Winogradskyella pelagia TaxID=2819984 RepID=A0ABS3T3N1_9FLAO|nr:hypothetical protein [Winogradskyella sp. DF17]MBO3117344.1 hypothetical protein [Winogradskyella sp. DF17]